MKKRLLLTLALLPLFATTTFAATGEALFNQFCASCHMNGGNIINPNKTLHKKDLDRQGITTWSAIVKNMRSPGPGMTMFDSKTISDKDARTIAEYVLKTFK